MSLVPPQKPVVLARCPICNAERTLETADTWWFVATPKGPMQTCSRECLLKLLQSLPSEKGTPLAVLKQGGCHVITPRRRE